MHIYYTVPWSVSLSVRLFVTFVHCAQTAEDIVIIFFRTAAP